MNDDRKDEQPITREDQAQEVPETANKDGPANGGINGPGTDTEQISVVGIGASAGGLEALKKFFTHMTTAEGMAFVVAQHSDPSTKSELSALLGDCTDMPTTEIAEGMPLEPNHIYTAPPGSETIVQNNRFVLTETDRPAGIRMPIDSLFRSIAEEYGDHAVCIILSGNGTDGTLGLKAVKSEGGMCMVQDPESAEFPGMPASALKTGLADCVTRPDHMPEYLIRYVSRGFGTGIQELGDRVIADSEDLQRVLYLVRSHTGYDFSFYKHQTIAWRIARRMTLHEIHYLTDYVRYLKTHPAEVESLYRLLLIGVTSFFRNPEAFNALKEMALAPLLNQKTGSESLRIWAPGCSTGEEAFTVALILREMIENDGREPSVQIFATDIDEQAIKTARAARYTMSIADDVPSYYLDKYFSVVDSQYIVNRNIRDMIVFAQQNVISDPPFTYVDLIVCRNLLIYVVPELQAELLKLFHFALTDNGYLFLGPSETIGTSGALFQTVDPASRIFKRLPKTAIETKRKDVTFPLSDRIGRSGIEQGIQKPGSVLSFRDVMQQWLLKEYTPPAVLVDNKGDIVYFSGDTGKFLRPAPGEPTFNLLTMAQGELQIVLATGIRKAFADREQVTYESVTIDTEKSDERIKIVIQPVEKPATMHGLLMVAFEPVPSPGQPYGHPTHDSFSADAQHRIRELERNLAASREFLQTTIEQLEVSNEELRASNQELQAANEQLQSSKQELHAVNRKLAQSNEELQVRMSELNKINNDLNNLVESTRIAVLFLDEDLIVRKFTPAAKEVLNLIDTDIGRPFSHIVSNLDYTEFQKDLNSVLEELDVRETQCRSNDGRWFHVRLAPYMTEEKSFEGVVASFTDVTAHKLMEIALKEREERMSLAYTAGNLGLWDCNFKTDTVLFNKEWSELLGYAHFEMTKNIEEWRHLIHPEDEPTMNAEWERHVSGETDMFEVEHRLRTKSGKWKWVLSRGRVTEWDSNGSPSRAVGIHMDISRLKAVEEAVKDREARLEIALSAGELGLWEQDCRTGYVYYSREWSRMLGYNSDDLQPDVSTWDNLLHPDEKDAVLAAWNRHVEEHSEMFETENRLRTRTGEWRWFLSRGRVTERDAEGRPVRAAGVNMDITPLKQTEAALQETQERLQLAMAGGEMGLWDTNFKTGESVYNEQWAEMLGYTLDEISPDFRAWEQLVHPDDRQRVLDAWERHTEGRTEMFESELRLRTKSGAWKWILTRGKATQWDARGNPARGVGIHLDISRLKKAEKYLKERDERFALALTGGDLGLWDADFIAGTARFNEQWVEQIDFPRRGAVQDLKTWEAAIHPDDKEAVMREWQRHAAGDTDTFEHAYRLPSKSGDWVWLLSRGRITERDSSGSPARAIGIHMDISRLKAVEAELREREERLSMAMTGGEMGLWDRNFQTDEIHYDDQWANMLGYAPEDISQDLSGWESVVHPDDRDAVLAEWNRHVDEHTEMFQAENRLRTKSGEWKWILSRGKVTKRDAEGQPLRAAGVNLDISRLKAAEDARLRAIAKVDDLIFLLEGLFSASPHHMLLLDLSGKCLFANNAALDALNLAGSELVGRHTQDFASQLELFADLENEIAAAISQDGYLHGSTAYTGKDQRREASYVLVPIKDENGEPVSVLASLQYESDESDGDIADHPYANVLSQCLNKSGSVMWLTATDDPDRLMYVSQEFETVWQRSPEEVVNSREGRLQYVHEEDVHTVRSAYQAFVNGEGDYDITYRIVRPDGSVRWIWDRAFPVDEQEENRSFGGLAIDITELKEKEGTA